MMNRLGRGYSFEALRAKILFSESIHKVKRPAFKRKPRQTPSMEDAMMHRSYYFGRSMEAQEDRERNYGADINLRVEQLESGKW